MKQMQRERDGGASPWLGYISGALLKSEDDTAGTAAAETRRPEVAEPRTKIFSARSSKTLLILKCDSL